LSGPLWVVELTYRSIFPFKFILRCEQSNYLVLDGKTNAIFTGLEGDNS
jgi:hypothetical protein